MKQTITTTIFATIFALILLSSSVFAEVNVSYEMYTAKYDSNGNFISSTNPVNDVKIFGYICADATCSTVSGPMWGGQLLSTGFSNTITLTYPTQLASPFGYAVFYEKVGYLPWVQRPDWAGTGTVPTVEPKYLTKVEACRSPIDTFAVINDVYPNQPIMVDISTSLDANTASPFVYNNIVGFHPFQLINHEKVDVQVFLEIVDQAGNVINSQDKIVKLDPSSTQRVMFDYTPTTVGKYSARVKTLVNDAKCISTDAQISQKNFNVIPQGPTNQCYTLLNNLSVTPQSQTAGQPVGITFEKISNYYDAQGALTTIGTSAFIDIVKDGQSVFTKQLILGANPNVVDNAIASAIYTPTQAGYYTVTVNGFSQNCPYTKSIADQVSQTFYVISDVVIPPTNNTNTTTYNNQPPVWLTLPGVTLQQNSTTTSTFNANLYVIDPDSNQLTFSIVSQDTSIAQCSVAANGAVTCNAVANGPVGTSTVTISANDAIASTQATFVVTVLANVPADLSCTGPGNITIADTSSRTYYQSATVPAGQTCVSEARACSSAVLSGSFQYTSCTVLPSTTNGACTGPDGFVIANTSSRTYFQSASVPVGQPCISELRQCNSGSLSGAFLFPSCTVGTVSSQLVFNIPNQVFEVRRNALNVVAINDISQYVINGRNLPLTYALVSQTGNVATCRLSVVALVCDALHGQDGLDTVTLSVTDGVEVQTSDAKIGVGIYDRTPSRDSNVEGLVISQFKVADSSVIEAQGGIIPVSLTIKNELGRKMKGATVTMNVIELDGRAKDGPFDLSSGNSKTVRLYVPVSGKITPGWYTVRLTIADNTDGLIRVEHRDLYIE